MTEAAEKLDRLEVPAGGIGEFVKTDEEIEALERQEAGREFGKDGIAYFNDVAGKMAGYGRFGDDSIAHIETGEIVVPKALIENNPQLKEQIFAELREAGIEDPEQYVVGSKANSINPETGLMEFGFLKKIFKKVGKFLKKAAGIILPVALNFLLPGIGTITASMLGSGIATLIQGGNFKDALKSSLLSGATAGVVKGLSGPGSFMENLQTKIRPDQTGSQMLKEMREAKGLAKAAEGVASVEDLVTTGNISGQDPLSNLIAEGAAERAIDPLGVGFSGGTGQLPANLQGIGFQPLDTFTTPMPGSPTNLLGSGPGGMANVVDPGILSQGGAGNVASQYPGSLAAEIARSAEIRPGINMSLGSPNAESLVGDVTQQSLQDAGITPLGPDYSFEQTAGVQGPPVSSGGPDVPKSVTTDVPKDVPKDIMDVLTDSDRTFFGKEGRFREIFRPQKFYGPDMEIGALRKYGPGALAAAGIMAATGGFEVPEQEDPGLFPRDEFGNPITGEYLIRKNPGQYLIADLGDLYLDPETGTYKRKGSSNQTLISEMLQARAPEQGPMMAAHGGDVEYPRRYGGIMPNEGIPDEDSVPALLMPGEFVFTTDAVKGLGDGSLNQGISRMYDVMSRLEKRGRQVA